MGQKGCLDAKFRRSQPNDRVKSTETKRGEGGRNKEANDRPGSQGYSVAEAKEKRRMKKNRKRRREEKSREGTTGTTQIVG